MGAPFTKVLHATLLNLQAENEQTSAAVPPRGDPPGEKVFSRHQKVLGLPLNPTIYLSSQQVRGSGQVEERCRWALVF